MPLAAEPNVTSNLASPPGALVVFAELRPTIPPDRLVRLLEQVAALPESPRLILAGPARLAAGCDELIRSTPLTLQRIELGPDESAFGALLAGARQLVPADLLIRLTLDHDADDRMRNRLLAAGVDSILHPGLIGRLLPLAAPAHKVAIALSSFGAIASEPLSGTGSADFIDRLAACLGLPGTALAGAQYYPQGNYALSGHFLARLLQRFDGAAAIQRDPALLLALDLGLTALARAFDLAVIDLQVKVKPADAKTLAGHAAALCRPAPRAAEYRPPSPPAAATANAAPAAGDPKLRVIAYYLPQFHPIPENDAWWGTGFTEWNNVSAAVPRFVGHYQPHLPADLGFYDLRTPGLMHRQVRLARDNGIHGFCFYTYWFNGRRLLEAPVEAYRADPSLDLPYCLCWANENWTRRWDGQESEILIGQQHSARDDLRFIAEIEPHLRDPRYLREDGKPMLLVYRAELLPDARATAERWRTHCRQRGIGEIHLVSVLSFAASDPRPLGFDAAVEFPPFGFNLPPINDQLPMVDAEFAGYVYDYRDALVQAAETRYRPNTRRPFPVINGCMLSWDNDSRRKGRGNVFHHASPQAYAHWLRLAALHGRQCDGSGTVFVNAWNEWAEGTHLEPDRRYGHAYLAATRDTVRLFDQPDPDLWPEPPAGLGFCSPLLNLDPPPPIHPRTATDIALYRQRFAQLGRMPRLRLVLTVDELGTPLFDTLYTLAEQLYRHFAVSVVSADTFAAEWVQPGPATVITVTDRSDLTAGGNRAIASAEEDWIVFIDAGDRLLPHSLLVLAESLAARPDSLLVYSDELISREETDGAGGTNGTDAPRHHARLKPEFDRTRLRHSPYLGGLLAVSRQALGELGGMDASFRSGELARHDLALRLLATHSAEHIHHLPEILFWRREDMAAGLHEEARQQQLAAIADRYLARIAPQIVAPRQVSIIIPTRNQAARLQQCVTTLFESTDDVDFELIVVDHRNDDPAALAFLAGLREIAPERVRVVPFAGDFNIAAINNHAARLAQGDALLFLNDDTAALHPGWLRAMVDELSLPEIGIVGARLLLPDGRLQHVGITLGGQGVADFAWSGQPAETSGRDGELAGPRQVGAVTGACLLVRQSLFAELGGFDESFSIAYADFEFCIRARAAGWHSVVTPAATLLHDAGASLKKLSGAEAVQAGENFRRQQDEFFRRRHAELAHDPAHHRELSLSSQRAELENNPALKPDPVGWPELPRIYGLPADPHGSGAYRVRQPVEVAHRAGRVRGRTAHGYPLPVVLDRLGIDIIHTQRQVDDGQLATLARTRELLPVRVVMDFDDLLTEVPADSAHKKEIWPDIERRITRACALSDVVTVSTEPLAERLRRHHDRIVVIPNALRRGDWEGLQRPCQPHARAVQRRRRRVGWAGGISHAGDLAVIGEVVRTLADEVDWVFFGMCPDELRPYLAEFHRGVAFEQYPAKLAGLDFDLALAPLATNAFNECKSNLRLLEYGALGIPVIATDITPYQGELPVTRLPNRPALWIQAIRERLAEPDALRRDGEALRQAVFSNWTVERQLDAWLAAWTGD